MKIRLEKIQKLTGRERLYLIGNTALRCPFHSYSEKEDTKVVEAYKAWLYRVVEQGQDPVIAAHSIGKESKVLASTRWVAPSLVAITAEIKGLIRRESLVLGYHRKLDPVHGLVKYLDWKFPKPEQASLLEEAA